MDITFISDTHGLHDELKLLPGMLLIHAGDITEYGTEEEVIDFVKWFAKQPFNYKIFIAGNHDLFLEECKPSKLKRLIPENIIYLQNSGIQINGINIWGSPVTPYFLGMAFNTRSGKPLKKVWDKIPTNTHILITHGPPESMLDNGFGCTQLMEQVNKIQPMVHVFGHVHQHNGIQEIGHTKFINAALVNTLNPMESEGYRIIGQPVCIII